MGLLPQDYYILEHAIDIGGRPAGVLSSMNDWQPLQARLRRHCCCVFVGPFHTTGVVLVDTYLGNITLPTSAVFADYYEDSLEFFYNNLKDTAVALTTDGSCHSLEEILLLFCPNLSYVATVVRWTLSADMIPSIEQLRMVMKQSDIRTSTSTITPANVHRNSLATTVAAAYPDAQLFSDGHRSISQAESFDADVEPMFNANMPSIFSTDMEFMLNGDPGSIFCADIDSIFSADVDPIVFTGIDPDLEENLNVIRSNIDN